MNKIRRKALRFGALTAFGFMAGAGLAKPANKVPAKVKMLTANGDLVEVDGVGLKTLRKVKKASKRDLLNWVSR